MAVPFEPEFNSTIILLNRNNLLQQILREQNQAKRCEKKSLRLFENPDDDVFKTFFFGTGTSATQTESFNVDNIQEFFTTVQQVAPQLGLGPAGVADNFNNLYPEDLARAQSIKNNAFQFSIEWSRVEPQEGVFDPTQINYYINVAQQAREHGLEPFVTIHHYDYPLWVQTPFNNNVQGVAAIGNDIILGQYAAFVRTIVTALKPYVTYWKPINEPAIDALYQSTFTFVPIIPDNILAAAQHLIQMHADAYHIIKEIYGKKKSIVIANIISANAYPENSEDLNNINATTWANYAVQELFLDAWVYGIVPTNLAGGFINKPEVANTVDLIDIHLYGAAKIAATSNIPFIQMVIIPPTVPPPLGITAGRLFLSPVNDFIRSTYFLYRRPIILGENGYPEPFNPQNINQRFPDSRIRPQYILETLSYLQGLKIQGVPIIGYLHWSLIDNWEIGSFAQRFGLFFVDRTTLARSPKVRSIDAYVDAITEKRITDALILKYPYIITPTLTSSESNHLTPNGDKLDIPNNSQ
jgi:beta-glucosidase